MHLEDLLWTLGHHPCGAAADAAGALALAERERPDLALMDLALAGGDDGREVARELRRRYGVPSLFVTGNPDLLETPEGRAAAPLGVVGKPFRDEDIANALKAAITLAFGRSGARRSC